MPFFFLLFSESFVSYIYPPLTVWVCLILQETLELQAFPQRTSLVAALLNRKTDPSVSWQPSSPAHFNLSESFPWLSFIKYWCSSYPGQMPGSSLMGCLLILACFFQAPCADRDRIWLSLILPPLLKSLYSTVFFLRQPMNRFFQLMSSIFLSKNIPYFFFFHLKIQSNFCSMSSHSSSVMRRRSCSFASKSCLGWLNSESAFLPPQISALKHLTLTVQFQRGQLWSRSAEKGAWRCSRLSHWPAIPTSHIISNPGCTIFDPLFCECSRRASEDDFECLGPQYPCGKPGWGPRNLASNWPCSSHLGSEPTNGKYFLSHSFKHAYVCVYIWINMHIIYI